MSRVAFLAALPDSKGSQGGTAKQPKKASLKADINLGDSSRNKPDGK
jgi:hypothetical protein